MNKIKKILSGDLKIFLHDFIYHFVYTLFIIGLTTLITYLSISFILKQQLQDLENLVSAKVGVKIASPNLDQDLYIERGSPYDNRTLDDSSSSSKVIFHGPRSQKKIALTFDAEMTDGMKAALLSGQVKSSFDPKIIDILNQTQTKATLFLTGMWIELYPKETKQLSSNPLFELGSHSYSDTSYHGFCYGLKQIPFTLAVEEIGSTEKLLREYAGIDNQLFRFPGGCYTPDDVKLVNQANDIVVHWDVSGADGFNLNTYQIINNVVGNTQSGSIIILHLNGPPNAPKTAEALPSIISKLKAKGFEFVKVNELLGLPPELRAKGG